MSAAKHLTPFNSDTPHDRKAHKKPGHRKNRAGYSYRLV
jgi:hypothetical protein